MTTTKAAAADDTIDIEALKRRYVEEREKRVRAKAAHSPEPDMKGKYANFDRDLYADPNFTRAAVTEDTEVLIIGGGIAGLLASARLKQKGITKFRIVEKGGDFGGTWYWNRYPGCQCDVEAYIYLPMLEELGYIPTERYARASEIHAHLKNIGKHFELYPNALFQTLVTDLRWNEARQRWIAKTSRNDEIAARFVISCAGPMSNPKLPTIPGIDRFKGHSFHTSRWDYDYTGGDQYGNLTKLKDKVIGVIGTGCTALQAVPYLAEWSKHLYVFQRTPSSVDERGNRPTDPAWAKSLKPGWQRERQNNFSNILSGGQEAVDLVQDGWTDLVRNVASPLGGDAAPAAVDMEAAGILKMENMRRRIDNVVKDKATAEALKPYYHYFCKRPGFHDEYLDTFNKPNVTLVDTAGQGVSQITQNGVIANGKEYKLDCLIYATGYDYLMDYTRETGMEVYGAGGVRISDHWKDGPRTLYAVSTDRFPNMFFVRLAQAGNSPNYTQTADEQTNYITEVIKLARARGATTVEATPEAVNAWVDDTVEKAQPHRKFLTNCTPGQYNHEGDPALDRFSTLSELHGGGATNYYNFLRGQRTSGEMKGLVFKTEKAS